MINVKEATIIAIGDTSPALTAASPIIKAPRIEMAEPKLDGNLKSLSLKMSQIIKSIITSIMEGNGTPDDCVLKLISKLEGIVS